MRVVGAILLVATGCGSEPGSLAALAPLDAGADVRTSAEASSELDAMGPSGRPTESGVDDADVDDSSVGMDVLEETTPDASLGWSGDCAPCYGTNSCPAGDTGAVCPSACLTPPIAPTDSKTMCATSVAIPWNGKPDASAWMLWCCWTVSTRD
jgi:hypothetical protein